MLKKVKQAWLFHRNKSKHPKLKMLNNFFTKFQINIHIKEKK